MRYNVQQSAECVGTFRWLEIQLMETLARWVPTTPEMEIKILFGRHVWDCAQHADKLGRRAFELRAPLHYTLPATPECQAWLGAIATLEPTAQRVSAFYDVACSFMVGQYRSYMFNTDTLLDEPTVRILEAALSDYHRMGLERARLAGPVFAAEPTTQHPPSVQLGASLANIVAHGPDQRRARGVPA